MRKILGRIWTIVWKTCLTFFVLSIVSVIVFRWVPIPFTPLMILRNIEQWSVGKSATFEHKWVSIDKISPNLAKAVIVSEDQKFMEHFGFDMEAMGKAYEGNKKGKKIK